MSFRASRLVLVLATGLLISGGTRAEIPSFGDLSSSRSTPDASNDVALSELVANATWTVPGFDPARDVPAMENWVPKANVEGAAHCFSISLLTTFFQHRVQFQAEAGEKVNKSWRRSDLKTRAVEPDAVGRQLLFEYLGTHNDGVKLKVGGYEGLRAFTTKGAAGTELFQRCAEAMQFLLQIPTMGGPYARSILFSSVDLLKKDGFTREGLNRRAFQRLRERLQEGHIVPFTMHPSVVRTDGHVIVGYEIRQTGSKAELVCYDSNYPPNSSGARPTVVHFDLEAGSYEVRNHYGTKSYTDYDVITTIDPENYFIRGMTREMTRELEKYLWLTDKFYTVMETVQKEEVEERWVDWKKDFLNAWKADKDRYKENTSRLLRYSIRMPR